LIHFYKRILRFINQKNAVRTLPEILQDVSSAANCRI